MSMPTYFLGISPCPNDTYIFDALVHARISSPFAVRTRMADVEELNSLAHKAALDLTKLSLAAVPGILDRYMLLSAGGALGRGCGPLVVARADLRPEARAGARIAIPGRLTTANLLLSLHGGFHGPRQNMVFDEVMPAVESGRAELGVIIHEGRFTYRQRGLSLVLDLGAWWEAYSGLPLPLGVIAIKRELGAAAALAVEDAIRRSILHARAHPEAGRDFIRAHAQEMDPGVMEAHINTFVNEFSLDLGDEGRAAILALLRAGAGESGVSLPDRPVFAGE